ncbi:MAG: trmK [Firmicutes bacterium]|nr:trmK [Bacillota bacterium]
MDCEKYYRKGGLGVKLGNRMAAIANMVPRSRCLADIGTDHAYLPVHLVKECIVDRAVAGDVHKGPYQSAVQTVEQFGCAEKISVRLGDGLAVLSPSEADVGVIAGMGGTTIVDILSKRPEVTKTFQRLVLQPMSSAGFLRQWLMEHEWMIVEEELVVEEEILYQIIMAEQGRTIPCPPLMYEIGPVLWEKRHPLLYRHLTSMASQLKTILGSMQASTQAAASPKFREYQEKLAALEEKIACL